MSVEHLAKSSASSFYAMEPPVEGRTSIVSDGVVVLHYMPKCVYIQMEGCNELFSQAAPGTAGSASQLAGPDLRGVLAITPQDHPDAQLVWWRCCSACLPVCKCFSALHKLLSRLMLADAWRQEDLAGELAGPREDTDPRLQ